MPRWPAAAHRDRSRSTPSASPPRLATGAGPGSQDGRPGSASSAAAATPAIAATGTVRIAISPWGNVEIDGAASGAAPPLTEMKLAEGRHQIVVRNGDFAPFVATINVVAGQTTSIRHKFGSGG
jgi:hypothetical protein